MGMRYALTTVDNPYDPLDEFRLWLEYDHAAGYDTMDYLSRITITSDELSDPDEADAVSQAIDEILLEHGDTMYRKVSRDYATDVTNVAS